MFGCSAAPPPAKAPTSIFAQVGGVEGLRPLVDELIWLIASDTLIGPTLAGTEITALKEQTLLFLCALTGGPCLDSGERPLIPYRGSPSAAARIVVGYARTAAQTAGVPQAARARFIERLERDIRAFIGLPR